MGKKSKKAHARGDKAPLKEPETKRENVVPDADSQGLPDPETAARTLLGQGRRHIEDLGGAWIAATGRRPDELIPQVVATVLAEGATRPAWQWKDGKFEYHLLAWPKVSGIRAAVLFRGEEGKSLRPASCLPLLEGVPNDLTIESVQPLAEGYGANVGCDVTGKEQPMWFYDPLYVRDREDLTPGVTQSVLLSALAFGVRKALLDAITITSGPAYEIYAAKWLEENPGKTRLDVPPYSIPIAGQHIIHPGQVFGQYQIRAVIQDIDDCMFESMPMKILYTRFPLANKPPLTIPIYVAQVNLGKYEPKVGDDIDAYAWFQGRIVDWDGAEATVDPESDVQETPGEK